MIGDKLILGNLIYFNSQFKIKKTSNKINTNKIENLFEIHSTNESFMLYATSKLIMNKWIDAISNAYKQYMSLPTSPVMKDKKKIFYAKTLHIPNDFTDVC
eukprot:193451_1